MRKYDLHIHSQFSDGEYTLEEIIEKLKNNGIEIFSITDHDNAESIAEMEKVDKKGLTYIPGIEFSTSKGKYKMHILGYGIDGHNEQLLDTCRDMKKRKNLRNLEVIQELKEKFGIIISKDETLELLKESEKRFVGQTTIAKLLVGKGIIPSVEYYFKNYFPSLELKTKATIDLDEAIRVIHAAGGLAVLAHPITFEKKYDVDIDDIFYIFKDAGIDGIEVFNSKHTLSDIKRFYKLSKRENLLISGGSDYHGEIVKPNIKLGKISRDDSEKKEHYEMTIISKCVSKNNELNKDNNVDKEKSQEEDTER